VSPSKAARAAARHPSNTAAPRQVPDLEPRFAKGEEKRTKEKEAAATNRSRSAKGRRVDEGGEMHATREQRPEKPPSRSWCSLAHLSPPRRPTSHRCATSWATATRTQSARPAHPMRSALPTRPARQPQPIWRIGQQEGSRSRQSAVDDLGFGHRGAVHR
jgi:hypothetical protein